jgi:hypothetical protein
MSIDYFIEKCLSVVTGPEFDEGNTTETLAENTNKTMIQEGNSVLF